MNKEKRKVPKLRFPDCNRLWEEYRLADLLVERSVLCTQSEKYPLVSFTVESGVTPKTERYDREALVVGHKASKKYKMTLVDDIVYNPANLKFGAIARNKYGNAVFSPIYVTLEVQTNRVFPKFIEYILTSKCFINRALRYQQGTVYERQSVNVESLLLQTVNIPAKDEQIKISDLLYKFDQLLGLYQHKLKMLLLKKKALLQKLFPKDGERYPELRFPGFTDAWEQRKLSDILKVNSGKDYKHLDQGNIPVYGTGGYMLSMNESLSNIDAIGIGRKGTIDKPQYLKAPFWTVDTLFYLTALDKHSILFLYYLMQLIPWKKFDESTGVPSLSKTTIDNISGFVPSNSKEEELISALFNQLDKSITLHQRKLDHLQLQKKALLQQMFV